MRFDLTVLDISTRGVQVTLRSTSVAFWLPRYHSAVVWSSPPEIGQHVSVRVPQWLAQKHGPLREVRQQMSISFAAPVELIPDIANREGSLPMAYGQNDRPPQGRGALFINKQKQQPNHPDRRGDLTLPAGYVLTLANGTALTLSADAKLEVVGWLKDTKAGEKYLSISAKPFHDRQQDRRDEPRQQPAQQQQAANSYAGVTGREYRHRQRSAGGPTFLDDDAIPFLPDR